uniref:Pectin acetylesterase n=1 Tax=Arcella intermedia TaxID=1963864 RepID=A0A6B2L8K1_9EUKA
MEGGGFCYDQTSCNLRWSNSKSLMSSKGWSSTREGPGILSDSPSINPYWHNASIMDIMYCSSDSYSGNKMNSDLNWNFMGSVIVESAIQDAIKRYGLNNARKVIFTGSSAGAEGLYPNANRVHKMVSPNTQFLVLLDSGWFLDFDPYRNGDCSQLGSCTEQEGLRRGVLHWNPNMDQDCAAAKQLWQCLLGYHAFPYIKSESFVFVYSYDSAGLGHDGIYNIPTSPGELAYAKQAALNITKSLSDDNVNAFFNPSCYRHTIEGDNNWGKLEISGRKLVDVIYEWTLNPSSSSFRLTDSCNTPNCNPTCNLL